MGKGARVTEQVAAAMKRRGMDFDLHVTTGPMDATRAAVQAIGRYGAVVAVGGDGTMNEVTQGLAHTDVPLGVVPGGSGNDFIRSLSMPRGIEEIVGVIERGHTRTIDLGRVNGKLFINGMGIGFDAVVNIESRKFKRLKGLPAYFAAFLKTIVGYRPLVARITAGDKSFHGSTLMVTIGNGRACGGGFLLTPRATPDDGLLDLSVIEPMWLPVLMWHLPKVFLGTIDRVKYCTSIKARSILVEGDEPLPSHMDGEVFSTSERSYEIVVLPKAMKVFEEAGGQATQAEC